MIILSYYTIEGSDFSLSKLQLIFESLSGNRMCVQVSATQDSILEEDETFNVEISSSDIYIIVNSSPSTVTIMDMDGENKYCSFVKWLQ